jgi:drug/metabolite transporter (DMT)-like permease
VLSAHLLVQAYGLRYTSAGSSGWIIGFIPVMIALGSELLGLQRLSRVSWAGVLVGTCGILVVVLSNLPDFQQARRGNLLQVASCVTWTIYTLAAAGPMTRSGVLRVTTFAMGVATVAAAAATLGTGVLSGPIAARPLAAIVILGLVCSGLAYYLWFAAVDEHGPARSGSLLYLEPVVAMITGAIGLGEQVVPNTIIGGLCVLAGVWLVARGTGPRKREGPPQGSTPGRGS